MKNIALALAACLTTALVGCSSTEYGIETSKKLSDITVDDLRAACESGDRADLEVEVSDAAERGYCISYIASSTEADQCAAAVASFCDAADDDTPDTPENTCTADADDIEGFAGCSATWGEYVDCFEAYSAKMRDMLAKYEAVTSCDNAIAPPTESELESYPAACEDLRKTCPKLFDDGEIDPG